MSDEADEDQASRERTLQDRATVRAAGYDASMEAARNLDFIGGQNAEDASALSDALRGLSADVYQALLNAGLVFDETIVGDDRQYRAFAIAMIEGNFWPRGQAFRPGGAAREPGERLAEVLEQARRRNAHRRARDLTERE